MGILIPQAMANSNDFRDLRIYQSALSLRKKIWKLVDDFPSDERFRLADQIIKSTRKCPANIAEGYGRYHWQENIQFVRIARGSLTETIDHLSVAEECGYIDQASRDKLVSETETLIKMINRFIQYLERKRDEHRSQ